MKICPVVVAENLRRLVVNRCAIPRFSKAGDQWTQLLFTHAQCSSFQFN